MIRLENIQKIYPNGFCAIKNINLHIHKGDIFGIIGYSGAGKSTLIRLINRLETPTHGKVLIQNTNILELNSQQLQKQRQKIGMIFQHFNLLSSKSVFENIAFALQIAKWKKSDIANRVLELLQLVGLLDKKDFYPSQLSGGQKQRVAIARALANKPDILLCDEATSALDSKTTKDILNLLKDIQKKLKITIVLITHQIEIVAQICNRVCVIDGGVIVEENDVETLFSNPKHPITKELLQNLPHQSYQDISQHGDKNQSIYELIFLDKNQNQPIISQAIKTFDIDINILSTDFNHLSEKTLGHMIVQMSGFRLNEALDWLQQQNIKILTKDHNA